MIRDKVSKHSHVARLERLAHALVFGREDAPVFEALHERVDVVDLVGLGVDLLERSMTMVPSLL